MSEDTSYPDVIPIHPELTKEELRELIEKQITEISETMEWPDDI